MNKVLVVDDWSGWGRSLPPLDFAEANTEVVMVKTVAEAAEFFNGDAGASVLVVGGVSGAPEFISSVRSRFPELAIIGLAEHREFLTNLGCNCFVGREGLGISAQAFLDRYVGR